MILSEAKAFLKREINEREREAEETKESLLVFQSRKVEVKLPQDSNNPMSLFSNAVVKIRKKM